jgi:phosphoglycolate phosphatase-like HAD superfamily hydrolase
MTTKVVLFDIDGTLLMTNGAGRRAMETALVNAFGTPGSPAYRYDGKTDRQIVRELMREVGRDDAEIDGTMTAVLDEYLERLDAELASAGATVDRCAGVHEILDAVEGRSDRVLGLLTGNLERGARRKLVAADIDPARFVVGAYGSDHEDRGELPAIALERARELFGGHVRGESLVIIGDTPSDIWCCRRVGARAIAVASGQYDMEELRRHEPAAVIPDLCDTGAVLDLIDRL